MIRVLGASPVNWTILLFYLGNLARLSLNFRQLYAKYPFCTTWLTNVLLLGLSDSIAQTLRSVANHRTATVATAPIEDSVYRYVLEHGRSRQVWLDEAGDDLAELGLVEEQESASPVQLGAVDETWKAVLARHFAKLTDFDFRRLFLFSAWGCFTSLLQSPWYRFLRTAYADDAPLVVVVQRVLADQLFYSPVMLAGMLSYLAIVIERQHWTVVQTPEFWQGYAQTLGVNLCVWPIAQFVNFLIIPSPAQIPFSSTLSVFWNTYLSLNTS